MESCSTCATLLPPQPANFSEKVLKGRTVPCCGRIICGECIQKNTRFSTYCPYCQISNSPTSLPQRLRDPPAYTLLPPSSTRTTAINRSTPPPYNISETRAEPLDTKKKQDFVDDDGANDVLHFLNHDLDSITSLSFRYGVPAAVLRRANYLTSDHLLRGRRTICIPGRYYKGGVSLSPRPVDGEAEERRKSKIRRFMTSCKVSDYDVAVLYLEQSDYDLGSSIEAYLGDEAWERDHPRHGAPETSSGRLRNQGPFRRGLSNYT